MIKGLIKYLLPLSILLLSVYGQLAAHTYKESTFYSPIKNHLRGSAYAFLGTLQNGQAFITKSSSSDPEKKLKIAATLIEKEENELHSSKKYVESSHFLTSIFCTQLLEYLFRSIHKGFLFCKHFSNTSSYRWHLIIQVFRI